MASLRELGAMMLLLGILSSITHYHLDDRAFIVIVPVVAFLAYIVGITQGKGIGYKAGRSEATKELKEQLRLSKEAYEYERRARLAVKNALTANKARYIEIEKLLDHIAGNSKK